MNDILKKLILKPEKINFQDGFYNRESSVSAEVSGGGKNYKYLLGLCGIKEIKPVKKSGCFYIGIGDYSLIEPADEKSYALNITRKGASITAGTEESLSNGVKMLVNIFRQLDVISCMLIIDKPRIDYRGAHFCICRPAPAWLEQEKMAPEDIKQGMELAALCGYNHIVLEFWGTFPYQKRPYAAWPDTIYTPDVVRGLVDFAIDDLHITPVPQQNLVSHAGWSRIATRRHVVLDQRPNLRDLYIPGGWGFGARNPDTKELIKILLTN